VVYAHPQFLTTAGRAAEVAREAGNADEHEHGVLHNVEDQEPVKIAHCIVFSSNDEIGILLDLLVLDHVHGCKHYAAFDYPLEDSDELEAMVSADSVQTAVTLKVVDDVEAAETATVFIL
jgi:hypothetical protein